MKLLLAASALIALSGCAVTPPMHEVTSQRIFVPLSHSADGSTSLTVVRDRGLDGAGCSSRLSLDGQLIVQVEQGEHVTVPVPSGSHQLKLSYFGACSNGSQQLSVNDNSGQSLSYRVAANGRSIQAASGS